jgi:NAD(P)-dependent dehydrogenase (short-subunit alcohol dehydrogenase family)
MRLKGTRAAVTGGNSGIGLAIARALSREGASVAIMGRDQPTLESAALDLGPGTVAFRGDVSDLSDLDRFYAEIESAYGGLDVLVANAGVYFSSPLDETTPEFFDAMSDVNFRGAFFTVQRALPLLREGASVILVTSTINKSGVPGLAVYAATKAALRSLARSLAAELMPRGIRVNALSPGIVDTPIFDRMGMAGDQVEGLKKDLQAQVPMGRLGTPDEIARAAVFLASGDSSYITGTELPVSGGLGQL